MKRIRSAEHKQSQKEWYKRNAEYMRDRQRNKRNELRKWLKEEVLVGKGCERCNESHVSCLDFHHKDPTQKELNISKMLTNRCNKEKILEEISKCEILCSNCHRKHHWEES